MTFCRYVITTIIWECVDCVVRAQKKRKGIGGAAKWALRAAEAANFAFLTHRAQFKEGRNFQFETSLMAVLTFYVIFFFE